MARCWFCTRPIHFQLVVENMLRGVVGLLVLLTVAAWLGRLAAVLELVSNFRFSLLLLAVVVMCVTALARRRLLLVVATLVGLVHLFAMLPYWTADADEVADGAETAEVLQYNIFFDNHDYDAVAAMINESPAVVVGLHEISDEQWHALQPLLTTHPHSIAVPVSADVGQLGGGMALLSRNPIKEIPVESAANDRARPILAFRTEVLGQPTTVVGLHPHASRFESAKIELRNDQLAAVADLVSTTGGPAVVVTDLNIAPHSPDYQDFVDDLGWRDPHRIVGWAPTWPALLGGIGAPIDHIFVSNEFLLHDYVVGPAVGSDHRSLTAIVSLAAMEEAG